MPRSFRLAPFAFALLAALPAAGEPLAVEEVPAPLQPWVDWVLDGHEEARCPRAPGGERRCAFPAELVLELHEEGGRFEQTWRVLSDSFVRLPGEDKRWPLDVRRGGVPAVVVPREGAPSVRLPAGEHTLTGVFEWQELPEALRIPPETALLRLKVRGEARVVTSREDPGRVWLARQVADDKAAVSRVDVRVHRKLVDAVPLRLESELELEVSGEGREEDLGVVLPEGFAPLSLSGGLPARLEPDGRLRVQVRPGSYKLRLVARHGGNPASLALPKRAEAGLLPKEEVWVFEASPSLRVVRVEGVEAIDPARTRLSEAWKRLPAYRMTEESRLSLVEVRRGDADPGPDQLVLRRTLWLDFDGKGLTLKDELNGTLGRSHRLEMRPPMKLGRISVDGEDQFITKLEGAIGEGVELRSRSVLVSADSRYEGDVSEVPIGWAHDFQSAQVTLHLPPGWRLFDASGVDRVDRSWLRRWTLLDLFLVLIVALALGRLYGPVWGVVALVGLGLTVTEPDAPRWAWLVVAAPEALVRVLPEGRTKKLTRAFRGLSLLVLLLFVVAFSATQVRQGMYPALEDTWHSGGGAGFTLATAAPPAAPGYEAQQAQAEYAADESFLEGEMDKANVASIRQRSMSKNDYEYAQKKLKAFDPNARVQTGPGLPRWTWRSVNLAWSGPVDGSEALTLRLLPPPLNLALAFVRVFFLALLTLCLLGLPGRLWPKALRSRHHRVGLFSTFSLLALVLLVAPAARAEAPAPPSEALPSHALLKDLKDRLLRPPPCEPQCASAGRLHLETDQERLRLRLEVDALADVTVPLPGSARQWLPSTVVVDGRRATALALGASGSLEVALAPGRHQVVLEGPLPRRETVQLPLPLKPHRIDVHAEGWTVDGVHDDGTCDDNLQLNRQRVEEGKGAELESAPLPPFAVVERSFALGLDWTVETRVTRMSPEGAAIVLELPLLPGEHVTSADVRVERERALVNLGPSAQEISWRSTLKERPLLELTAPEDAPFAEVWQVVASPIWHVETKGIPPIHDEGGAGPSFRPWPGEKLVLEVSRPTGTGGQTLTVDSVDERVRPGERATDVTLLLELRSSRGDEHTFSLPEGAELTSVRIDGRDTPLRLEGHKLTLPLVPGRQRVELSWREKRGISALFSTSAIDLGTPSVNPNVQLHLPAGRWVLFAYGPRLGPAVLFWSLLFVVLVISLGLSRVRSVPLGFLQWFLLGVGLTQVPLVTSALVAGWLLALGWRKQRPELSPLWFNLRQLALLGWTLVAAGVLIAAIREGLLGAPDMQVEGNGSSSLTLRWTHDRASGPLPQGTVLSVPLLVYRGLMLAWALWLAYSLVKWARFGWEAFSTGGLFKRSPPKPKRPSPAPNLNVPPGAPTSAAPLSTADLATPRENPDDEGSQQG